MLFIFLCRYTSGLIHILVYRDTSQSCKIYIWFYHVNTTEYTMFHHMRPTSASQQAGWITHWRPLNFGQELKILSRSWLATNHEQMIWLGLKNLSKIVPLCFFTRKMYWILVCALWLTCANLASQGTSSLWILMLNILLNQIVVCLVV